MSDTTAVTRPNYRITDAKCCGTCAHLATYKDWLEEHSPELTCLIDDSLEEVSVIGLCDNYEPYKED